MLGEKLKGLFFQNRNFEGLFAFFAFFYGPTEYDTVHFIQNKY